MKANQMLRLVLVLALAGEVVGLELYYFNERGSAEPIRLMLHYAGTNFTDYRFSRKDWNDTKSTILFQTMPALVQDWNIIENSQSITRYVARTSYLETSTYFEDGQMDALFEKAQVMLGNVMKYLDVYAGRVPGNESDARYTYVEQPAAIYYPLIEQHINDNMFFGVNGITYMDFVWYNISDLINYYTPEILQKYMKSIQHWGQVEAYPNANLQRYLRTKYINFARNGTILITNNFYPDMSQ